MESTHCGRVYEKGLTHSRLAVGELQQDGTSALGVFFIVQPVYEQADVLLNHLKYCSGWV